MERGGEKESRGEGEEKKAKKKITCTWEYWKWTLSNGNERNCKKRVPEKNKKTRQNQALQQKFHQRNKHLDSPLCKIFWTILKMHKEGTQTDRSKVKEIADSVQGLTPKRWCIQYMFRKVGRRELVNIENHVDVTINWLEEYTKKS